MDAGNINVINRINYGNVEGRVYGVGGILGYITNNGEIIKIENSCNFGNFNVLSSGISYSGTRGIIGLNQYSSTQIELNVLNCSYLAMERMLKKEKILKKEETSSII